jgi:hypothetical protein
VREEEDFQQIAAALPNLVNVGMSIQFPGRSASSLFLLRKTVSRCW